MYSGMFLQKYQRLGDRALNTPLFIPQFFLVAKKTFIKFLELNSKNPVLNCIINLLSVFIMSIYHVKSEYALCNSWNMKEILAQNMRTGLSI